VGTDDVEIIRLAIEHLAEIHQIHEASYFGGIGEAGPHLARKDAFDRAIAARNIKNVEPWNAVSGPNPTSAYEAAYSLLKTEGIPEAIVCHSDSIAIGLIRALDEVAIPPGRCAIVSIDGIGASAMTTPPLTTIAVDPGQMGRNSGHLLLRATDGERLPLSPRLIVRRSCGCRRA
jgi:LacI family transcriptional regulator